MNKFNEVYARIISEMTENHLIKETDEEKNDLTIENDETGDDAGEISDAGADEGEDSI